MCLKNMECRPIQPDVNFSLKVKLGSVNTACENLCMREREVLEDDWEKSKSTKEWKVGWISRSSGK